MKIFKLISLMVFLLIIGISAYAAVAGYQYNIYHGLGTSVYNIFGSTILRTNAPVRYEFRTYSVHQGGTRIDEFDKLVLRGRLWVKEHLTHKCSVWRPEDEAMPCTDCVDTCTDCKDNQIIGIDYRLDPGATQFAGYYFIGKHKIKHPNTRTIETIPQPPVPFFTMHNSAPVDKNLYWKYPGNLQCLQILPPLSEGDDE